MLLAQKVTGIVTDSKTGTPLPYVNVYYYGKNVGCMTDDKGYFSIPYKEGWTDLNFSLVGYNEKAIKVTKPIEQLKVSLQQNALQIAESVVKAKKSRYSRKDNPAVELMKKVIAAKKNNDLSRYDYYSFDKYEKLTFAINDFTPKVFDDDHFKKMSYLKDHVEVCNETGKLILPLTVDETIMKKIYRKEPKSEKEIITGKRSEGVNDLFNTGEILTTVMKDCFTDVNIYENNIRLLQSYFISPISSTNAISFYRYFIMDTLMIANDRCIEVSFTPNNPQDFGFTGSLYIIADSTYRVRRVSMGLPKKSDVNFVDNMRIIQEYRQLPTGEQVVESDDMLVQLELLSFITKFQVRRSTYFSGYSLNEIPEKSFKVRGEQYTQPDALMRDKDFWEQHRPVELTSSEGKMDRFVKELQNTKGFKFFLFVAKAFIENFVETSANPEKPSKVDFGPVNTTFSQNFVDGFRLRASAQTTANFNPHLFTKGYIAYGFKDNRWKGLGEVTYSFNKKEYLPREYPVNNLTFTYQNDVMSPSDKFMPTDKDNVFTSFKFTTVDHMMYVEKFRLLYEREWENGLRITTQLKRQADEPTAALFYQPLDGKGSPSKNPSDYIHSMVTTDAMFGITYSPGATYVNTKQRRLKVNQDAPIYSLNHTVGLNGIWGCKNTYNYTEASVYKRFWLASWGNIDIDVKGGIQWNKVPFPLLIMPAANLSYIKEDGTFSLINNMEFLNDRFASLMFSWDLNGKIFNRIPLLKKLKWREYLGCNILWGTLTDKNNPFLAQNSADNRLFYFPGHFDENGLFQSSSTLMDSHRPYIELVAGIHNIFKLFHVEYVRRMNYLDNSDVHKWGIRLMFRVKF